MLEDTIAAIATAPGIGGIGIIRVSGKEAFSVVSHVFKPKDAFFNILNPTPNTIKYGTIIEEGKVVDEGNHNYLIKNNEMYKNLYEKESV